jgi:hypothetical protein
MRENECGQKFLRDVEFCMQAALFSLVPDRLFAMILHIPDILFLMPFFIWSFYLMVKNKSALEEGLIHAAMPGHFSSNRCSLLKIMNNFVPLTGKYKQQRYDYGEKNRTTYATRRNNVPLLVVGGLARRKRIKRASGTAPKKAGDDGDGGDGETPRPRSYHSPTLPLHHSLTHSLIFFVGGAL